MWRLDIPKTRQYDHGKIEVIARNAAGEAYTACELNVTPKQDDYRAMLKNSPKREWFAQRLVVMVWAVTFVAVVFKGAMSLFLVRLS